MTRQRASVRWAVVRSSADPDIGRQLGCARGRTQDLRFGLAQGGGWAGSPGGPTPDVARPRYGSRAGTRGPGAFDNDDAPGLLDALSGQDTAARRQVLEQIFREAREHPENLNFTPGAAEVAAAAAIVAAGLHRRGRRAGDHQGAAGHRSYATGGESPLDNAGEQMLAEGLPRSVRGIAHVIPAPPAIGGDHSGRRSGLCGGLADRAGGREEVFNQRRLAGFGDGQADLVGCQFRDGHVADVRA